MGALSLHPPYIKGQPQISPIAQIKKPQIPLVVLDAGRRQEETPAAAGIFFVSFITRSHALRGNAGT